ncbi:MAG: hypothetical protein IKM43_04250 [Clostridia bacterium]|nr:hypothetical protein [Clostridia bacterium]
MTKNLKLSFILLAIFSAIIMTWRTLTYFFCGVGLNYIALLAIVVVLLIIMINDSFVKNRIKDMFIVACVFAVIEFMVYFVFEFETGDTAVFEAFWIVQNIYTFLGILFFCYIMFRLFTEIKGVKFGFVEAMLGNEKPLKPKKAKELENGTLEEKPNHKDETEQEEQADQTIEFETMENEEN